MQVDIKHRPAYSLAIASLSGGEAIRAEPGAMVSYSAGVTTDTKVEGGLFRRTQAHGRRRELLRQHLDGPGPGRRSHPRACPTR